MHIKARNKEGLRGSANLKLLMTSPKP